MSLAADFKKKSVVIVTGASRGIGSAIATNLAKKLHPNSAFLLLARSEQGLIDTKKKIEQANKNFTVKYNIIDFIKPDIELYESMLEDFIKSIDISDVTYAYCFHNAAHLGTLIKAVSLTDLEAWRSHYDINLFSTVLLNSAFMNKFRPVVKQLVITNITSGASEIPIKDLAMYGSSKAARNLYFKVLALEEPECWVLSYSPGSVDTEMFNSVIVSAESDEVKKLFSDVKKTSILTPDQTVQKLLQILFNGAYKNGDYLDYEDMQYSMIRAAN